MDSFNKFVCTSILIVTSPTFIYSQHIFEEKQYGCNYDGMSLENSKITIEFSSYKELYEALTKDVEGKVLMKVKGKIMMQIVIEPNGSSCCVSISNKTNVSSNKLELVRNINSLTGWKSLSDNPNRRTCILLSFNFGEKDITIERLGSNALREPTVLETFKLERK